MVARLPLRFWEALSCQKFGGCVPPSLCRAQRRRDSPALPGKLCGVRKVARSRRIRPAPLPLRVPPWHRREMKLCKHEALLPVHLVKAPTVVQRSTYIKIYRQACIHSTALTLPLCGRRGFSVRPCHAALNGFYLQAKLPNCKATPNPVAETAPRGGEACAEERLAAAAGIRAGDVLELLSSIVPLPRPTSPCTMGIALASPKMAAFLGAPHIHPAAAIWAG